MSRKNSGRNPSDIYRGFTIVELLLVIVVIAILALITIASYNGVTSKAIETSMKSDLHTASSTVELDHTHNGSYPASAAAANGGRGIPVSTDNTLTYVQKPYGYCASVSNPRTSNTFVVKSVNNRITEGTCDILVSTFSGTGTAGSTNGPATIARFNYPFGIAIDRSGTLYVAEWNNHLIRKVTTDGEVSTLAGSTQGNADGNGANAQFNNPTGIAVDTSGNLYVADSNNHRIRKVTQDGEVTTIAGSTAGFANGTETAARFNTPTGIAVDSTTGNIYVSDTYNHRIRKVTQDGEVTTIAGGAQGYADGIGTNAQFDFNDGIALYGDHTLYIVDGDNDRIRQLSLGTTVVTTVAGSGVAGFADGQGTAAQFNSPWGIAVDNDNGVIYVGDSNNHRIRIISPTGAVTTAAGSSTAAFANGLGTAARFDNPKGIAVDPNGNAYVADRSNNRIRMISL